jgi:hypothetical protein
MNSYSLLLAVHVTLALGLTILLGIQTVLLEGLARPMTAGGPSMNVARAILASVPVVTVAVAVTGGMLLRAGTRGGPWIAAGVLTTLVIVATSLWSLWYVLPSRESSTAPAAAILAAQWAAPLFTLAAAFLMAYRPIAVAGAAIPIVIAVAVAAAGSWATSRARTPDGRLRATLQRTDLERQQ